jgi:site-specific recombinase XerD
LPKVQPFDYVFRSKAGHILNKNIMAKMWKNFKREMQINAGCKLYRNKLLAPYPIATDLVPYCYRHTFCTDLQDAGVQINIAKDLMGHSNISITAKIYTHMTENQLEQTAERIATFHRERTTPIVNTQ